MFFVLGLVSLFGDLVYEGARSVSGAYLDYLKAPVVAAAIIGVGDLVGFSLRFISGYIATVYQSSGIIWALTIMGYTITAISMPMLAYASTWSVAVLLYMSDRVGKGLRAPARDIIVAEVSEGLGVGKGFGIHELLDQLGAFAGPTLVAVIIAIWGYKAAFLTLLAPGLVTIGLVLSAYKLYPVLKSVSVKKTSISFKGYSREFYYYTIASSSLMLGFIHWAIVSYYLSNRGVLSAPDIGFMYAVAMVVDAIVAIPLGILFDKVGLKILLLQPPLSLLFTILLVNSQYLPYPLVYLTAIPWGIVMCSEESVMRASIAVLVEPSKRPFAYGLFGLLVGVMWMIGGFIYSLILENPLHVLVYSSIINIVSAYFYMMMLRRKR